MAVETPVHRDEAPGKEMSPDKILRIAAKDFTDISAITAIHGVLHVDGLYKAFGERLPNEDEIKKIGKGMDHATVPIAEREFHRRSRLRIAMIASEGEKDDAPFLKGEFGPIDSPRIEVVHDTIDGTRRIAAKETDSISIISGSDKFEKIPSENLYMVSITVPIEAKKAISLALDKAGHKQVLSNICEELKIKPQELTQIMLNPNKKGREVNSIFFEAGLELGVKHKLLDAGDVMPRTLCSLSQDERLRYCDKYGLNFKDFQGHMVMVGRGGTPELSASSAAGKITGAPTIAYLWNPNIKSIDTQNIFTTEKLVPGKKESTIVVSTFATESTWFKQPGVQINHDGSYTTSTLILTAQNGLAIATNTYHQKDLD
jgi:fructose-1,6-bisphosphatase/sedoheptulose 1,7-bisphosphatase-like protein